MRLQWGPTCLLPLLLLLLAGGTAADNVDLFWNLYDAVISGGRILHDVANGVGAVSKAIRAIDSFLDTAARAQVSEAREKQDQGGGTAQEEGPTAEQAEPSETTPDPAITVALPDPSPAAAHDPLPSFSGCGALGLHIRDDSLPMTCMTNCCFTHDSCYGASCKANKKDCDGKLRSCLYAACEEKTTVAAGKAVQQKCKGAAKLLFSGTMALSFQQFSAAQEKLACRKPQKVWKGR